MLDLRKESKIKTIPKEYILMVSHTRERVMNSLQKNILWSLSSTRIKIDVWVRYEGERWKVMTTIWKKFYSASKFIVTTTAKAPRQHDNDDFPVCMFGRFNVKHCYVEHIHSLFHTSLNYASLIISKCLLLHHCESWILFHIYFLGESAQKDMK